MRKKKVKTQSSTFTKLTLFLLEHHFSWPNRTFESIQPIQLAYNDYICRLFSWIAECERFYGDHRLKLYSSSCPFNYYGIFLRLWRYHLEFTINTIWKMVLHISKYQIMKIPSKFLGSVPQKPNCLLIDILQCIKFKKTALTHALRYYALALGSCHACGFLHL